MALVLSASRPRASESLLACLALLALCAQLTIYGARVSAVDVERLDPRAGPAPALVRVAEGRRREHSPSRRQLGTSDDIKDTGARILHANPFETTCGINAGGEAAVSGPRQTNCGGLCSGEYGCCQVSEDTGNCTCSGYQGLCYNYGGFNHGLVAYAVCSVQKCYSEAVLSPKECFINEVLLLFDTLCDEAPCCQGHKKKWGCRWAGGPDCMCSTREIGELPGDLGIGDLYSYYSDYGCDYEIPPGILP
jgi:hypothetical protein